MNETPTRVLLVEDNPLEARLIQEMLDSVRVIRAAPLVFVTEWVDQLSAGLERLAAGGIDAVLLDLMLPDSSGLDSLVRLYEQVPHVPIIVLTGLDDEELAAQAVRAGAQDYLVKGAVDSRLLAQTIRYAIERKRAEAAETLHREALRASNYTLQSLVQASPSALVMLDPAGCVKLWNPAAERIFGWSEPEVLGRALPIVPPDKQGEFQVFLADVLGNQTVSHVETRRQRKDGALIDVSISTAPLRDAHGDIVGAVGLLTDITERKQTEEALRQRTAQLALLNEVGRRITAVLDLDTVLEQAVCLVQQHFGYHHVALFTVDATRGELAMRARVGSFVDLFPLDHRLKLGQGMVGWTGSRGEKLLSNDVRTEPHFVNLYPDVIPTRSELSVPVCVGDEIVGVLDVQSPHLNAFTENDVTVIETVAGQIAVAIQNARLYEAVRQELNERQRAEEALRKAHDKLEMRIEERTADLVRTSEVLRLEIAERWQAEEALQQRNRELTLLNQASQAFSSTLDLDQVLAIVLEGVRHLLNVAACSIWLTDPATGELVCQQVADPQDQIVRGWRLAPGQGLAGRVAYHGESRIVPDTRADPRYIKDVDQHTGQEQHSILCVPLRVKEGVIGVLEAVDTAVGRFQPADQVLIESLAASAAIAIENARLFEAVSEQREQLRALAARLAATEETERQRLARELHDRVGQNLTALGINLSIIRSQCPPGPVGRMAEEGLALVEETARRIRDVMADLRPPVLDDYGLVAALHWYGERVAARTGLAVDVQGEEPEPRLAAPVEIALFRIAQEALTNAVKHAQASQATVAVEAPAADAGVVRLVVTDDGVGFDPASQAGHPGWGLITMTERAEAVGGRCRVESSPGAGTQVVVEVPR